MNSNLSDIGTALTQSLATTGVAGMTGPLKLAAGTIGAPSLTLVSDTTTGWYNSAAGEWTYVSVGVAVLGLSDSGASLIGSLTVSTSLQVGASLIVGTTTSMLGILTIAVASNTAVFRNTTNNTSINTIITFQQGSGAGQAASIRAVGLGANDISGILGYMGANPIWAYGADAFQVLKAFDLLEIAAPASPTAGIARIFAFDDGAATRLAMKNDAGLFAYIAPAGSIITSSFNTYVLNTNLTGAIPIDDTIPQIGEGDPIISQAITIKNAGSRIRVRAQGQYCIGNASVAIAFAIFDGAANAIVATVHDEDDTGSNDLRPFTLEWEYAAPSAGVVTYSLRSGVALGASAYRYNGSTSTRVMGGVSAVTLSIQEIQQ